MFETPPAWWPVQALANLTAWFYWPAMSAVFSAAALGWAIFLANQNARHERKREANTLKALLYVVATTYGFVRDHIKMIEGSDDFRATIAGIAETDILQRSIEMLDSLKIQELPSCMAIDHSLSARISFRGHQRTILNSQSSSLPALIEDMRADLRAVEDDALAIAGLAVGSGARPRKTDDNVVRAWLKEAQRRRSFAQSLKSFPAWLRTTWTGRPRA